MFGNWVNTWVATVKIARGVDGDVDDGDMWRGRGRWGGWVADCGRNLEAGEVPQQATR